MEHPLPDIEAITDLITGSGYHKMRIKVNGEMPAAPITRSDLMGSTSTGYTSGDEQWHSSHGQPGIRIDVPITSLGRSSYKVYGTTTTKRKKGEDHIRPG